MVPIMDVIYLLYSIVLMLSVIIAVFNSIYSKELAQSELIYKFLRYSIITEYESRPLLPPPFIIFSWIYAAFRALYKYTKDYRKNLCRRGKRGRKKQKRHRSRSSSSSKSSSKSSRKRSSSGSSSDSSGNSFDIGHIVAPRMAISNGGQQSDALSTFVLLSYKYFGIFFQLWKRERK